MQTHIDARMIRIGGQDLRYALIGPEHATRTLLLFNGIGASLETVQPFASHFQNTRILTFDVPGVGGSPAPQLPYRFGWLSRLAGRLLDRLGIGAVDVFGVSWGGALAQQFVHDHPERCRALVLAATSAGFVMVPGPLKVLSRLGTPRRYSDPDYMRRIGPDIYGGLFRVERKLLEEHLEAMQSGSSLGYLYQLLAITGWTSWLWLPGLKLPVLIMMGADDPIVPEINGRLLARRLPDARLQIVDCGHLFIISQPEQTARTVETFITDARRAVSA